MRKDVYFSAQIKCVFEDSKMNIVKTIDGSHVSIALDGFLDTNTSAELKQAVEMEVTPDMDLTIDCAKVEYVSSAGLRVFLATHKKFAAAKGLVIKNVNDSVKEVLQLTGFDGILNIQ